MDWQYIVTLFCLIIVIGGKFAAEDELNELKQQAFERGHMVQCVGKTGYYWECK